MIKQYLFILTLLFIACDSDDPISVQPSENNYTYTLEDLNPSSNYYNQNVGTSSFPNQITIHYFGHYSWGTCSALYGQLNELYENLILEGYNQVKLIGIGKSSQISFLNNWTDTGNASVCADTDGNTTWNNWGAVQRDLYILDHEGNVVFNENISSGLPDNLESTIIDYINLIPSF